MQGWRSKWRRAGLIAVVVSPLSSCLLTSSFEGLTGGPADAGADAPEPGASASSGAGGASSTATAGQGGASSSSGAGGVGGASSSSGAGGVGGAFPSTPLLDDFNRPDGPLGGAWLLEKGDTYTIASNMLGSSLGDPGVIIWPDTFGPDQEAYLTIQEIDPADTEQELILKSQGVVGECESLQVDYQYPNLELHQCVGGNFADIGTGIALVLKPGDQLGARAYANGTVEAYKNGVLVKSWDATAWPFYSKGGRIGWASYGVKAPSRLDNFGGGG